MYDSIMRVMEEAVRIDMRLALEPVWWHPLEDSETTLEVVKRVNDPKHLRLIFDASNLLKDPTGTKQHEYWTGWLDAIGSHVDVMHIKDFSLGQSGEYEHELLGNGVIQYEAIRQWLKKQNREIYLLREEMKPAFAGQDINFIRNLYC